MGASQTSSVPLRLSPLRCCKQQPGVVQMGQGRDTCLEIECGHCQRLVRIPGCDRDQAVRAWNAALAPEPQPQSFSVLASMQTECSSLLLGSFMRTHHAVLEVDDFDDNFELGIRVAVGDCTHRASGIRYVIAVAALPGWQQEGQG